METINELVTYWEKHGGVRFPFRQTEFLRDNPSVTTVKYKNGASKNVTRSVEDGICHALSLRFIEGRMIGLDAQSLIDLIDATLAMSALQQAMILSGKKSGSQAGGVDGTAIKGKGFGGLFRPFGSRRELTDFLVNSPGLYEYGMYGRLNIDGHSVAFDCRSSGFYFFDANSGIWYRPGRITDADMLYELIHDYWDYKGYKNDFRWGSRDMHQFA